MHYRARYFDPASARFASEDPLRFVAGDVNFYRYVMGGPVNSIDPMGLDAGGAVQLHDDTAELSRLIAESDPEAARLGVAIGAAAMGAAAAGAAEAAYTAASFALTGTWLRAQPYLGAAWQFVLRLFRSCPSGATVTPEGLARVEQYLARFGDPANQAMVERLRSGYRTAQDVNFYAHELIESRLVERGMELRAAHLEALAEQGIKYQAGYEALIYHPDVIMEYADKFNPAAWPK